jgi:hypothetical protein
LLKLLKVLVVLISYLNCTQELELFYNIDFFWIIVINKYPQIENIVNIKRLSKSWGDGKTGCETTTSLIPSLFVLVSSTLRNGHIFIKEPIKNPERMQSKLSL